jgi:hypothetical protein
MLYFSKVLPEVSHFSSPVCRAIAYKFMKLFGVSGWEETCLTHLHTRLNDAAAPAGMGGSSVPNAQAYPQHQ